MKIYRAITCGIIHGGVKQESRVKGSMRILFGFKKASAMVPPRIMPPTVVCNHKKEL